MRMAKELLCLTFGKWLMTLTGVFAIKHGSYYDITFGCELKYGIVMETVSNIRSIEECSLQCDETRQCISVKYDPANLQCHLNTYRLPEAISNTCTAKFVYAELKKSSNGKLVNDKCIVSDDCSEPNSQCARNKCQCKPGFGYKHNNASCLSSCGSYGWTFTYHPGHYLARQAYTSFWAESAKRCLQQCAQDWRHLCRSADFDPVYKGVTRRCYHSGATALTAPRKYRQSPSVDHYQRNCQ